jgi:DnaK suppressor protein
MMTSTKPTLDKSFIQKQHHQLTKLREQLLAASRTREAEETGIHTESAGEAHEAEDDAQKLALLELDGNAIAYSAQRLAQIERALQKIADGTYGLSDASGEPIPRERLEAVPEATYTVAELKAREPAATPPATGKHKP